MLLSKLEFSSEPLVIDCLIDNLYYVQSMIDTGCLCFAVFDENLVRKHKLHRIAIQPRPIKLADGKIGAFINEITCVNMDIDGRLERVWGYVMPKLAYPIILGKPWMEKNDVVYLAKRRCLRIGSRKEGIIVRATDWYKSKAPAKVKSRVAHVSAKYVDVISPTSFTKLCKQYNPASIPELGAVSMHDITRALEKKKVLSIEEVRSLLPEEVHQHAELFLDDGVISNNSLPPHRPGVDTKITLKKNNQGQEREIPWGPLYGMSRDELLVLRKTLTELLDKNWIRASSSPGGAPVLFIKKPGGGLRFCVNYRALNEITDRDRYPLPLIRETLRLVSRATWLSKVDVRSAFHRLRIAKGDEWKTAFRTRFGSYEWLVTPFGLAGAPAAFQRWVNQILGNLLGVTCAAYLDDIIIFSEGDLGDHWNKVNQILTLLKDAGLQLDPAKCAFAAKEIKYLGYVINVQEGIKMDPKKIEAITSWEPPKNIKEVRSFLGFANFYRGFIRDFASISDPLHALTKKGTPFIWNEQRQSAFDNLKQLFTTAPILNMWQEDRETILETDASGWAVGGCLSQYDNGILYPVAYFSKKLTPVECNYNIHDKELLAIIKCLNEWRAELIGLQKPFSIFTDHSNLRYFMKSQKLTERHVRWSQFLSQFDFRLTYRSGSKGERPDALSRRQQDIPKYLDDPRIKEREFQMINPKLWISSSNEIVANLTVGKIKVPKGASLFEDDEMQSLWNKGVEKDNSFHKLYSSFLENHRSFPAEMKLKTSLSECSIDNRGALCFRNRLWIPDWEPLKTALIQRSHDSHATGHPGRNNTLAIISREFYWPLMSTMVRRFCRNCDVCGRSHVWRTRRQGLLLPLPVPDRFHKELSIDFMTDLPKKTPTEPSYLMVITDRLLKSVTLEAMNSMEAKSCAERFLNCHYRFHGFPTALTSDRGSNWVGEFWTTLCKGAGIEQRLSTAFHPETDGSTERMNQEVLAYIRAFISYSQFDWAKLLPSAQLALNNRNSSISGLSPFFLEHGYHVEPIQQKHPTSKVAQSKPAKLAEDFLSRLREAQEYASAAMAAAQMAMEEQANKKRNPSPQFRIGDKVWLHLKNVQTTQPKKKLGWVNAKYKITKIISPHVVELDVPSKIWPRFHVELLRKANDDPLPSQIQDDTQPSPVFIRDNKGSLRPEQIVERILRAEKFRRGKRWIRRVLVKWKGFAEPNWEDRSDMEDVEALDFFESKFGKGDGVGEDEGARQGQTHTKRKKKKINDKIF